MTGQLGKLSRYIISLLIFEIIIVTAGFIFVRCTNTGISFIEIIVLSSVFMVLAILTLIIFLRGQSKEPSSQSLHSLVSISSKFLAEMIFAFIWFILAKKTGLPSVILFFVLYLAFTLFSVTIILKTLKNKSL